MRCANDSPFALRLTLQTARTFWRLRRYLRGLCEHSGLVHDDLVHHERPFCWTYKLPQYEDVYVYMRQMLPNVRIFKMSDDSRWVAFIDEDNEMMETKYSDPETGALDRILDMNEPYPFAGRCQILFGNVREDIPFKMTTRLKCVSSRGGLRGNAALSSEVEMQVRCFRTPSCAIHYAVSPCATKWRWYFRLQQSTNEDEWTDCAKLVGHNAANIEHAYAGGLQSVTIAALAQQTNGLADLSKQFTLDFAEMIVWCAEGAVQTNLRSRPELM